LVKDLERGKSEREKEKYKKRSGFRVEKGIFLHESI
jgi:hypothetical protein